VAPCGVGRGATGGRTRAVAVSETRPRSGGDWTLGPTTSNGPGGAEPDAGKVGRTDTGGGGLGPTGRAEYYTKQQQQKTRRSNRAPANLVITGPPRRTPAGFTSAGYTGAVASNPTSARLAGPRATSPRRNGRFRGRGSKLPGRGQRDCGRGVLDARRPTFGRVGLGRTAAELDVRGRHRAREPPPSIKPTAAMHDRATPAENFRCTARYLAQTGAFRRRIPHLRPWNWGSEHFAQFSGGRQRVETGATFRRHGTAKFPGGCSDHPVFLAPEKSPWWASWARSPDGSTRQFRRTIDRRNTCHVLTAGRRAGVFFSWKWPTGADHRAGRPSGLASNGGELPANGNPQSSCIPATGFERPQQWTRPGGGHSRVGQVPGRWPGGLERPGRHPDADILRPANGSARCPANGRIEGPGTSS